MLSSVKLADDRSGDLIVRVYEPCGRRGVGGVVVDGPYGAPTEVTLLEEPLADTDASSFPAYVRTVHPWVITDSLGQPVKTKGSVVIRSGTKVVGTVKLANAVRRLLFSAPWPGKQKTGTYSATVTLTDAMGRVMTATQTITVAKSSVGLCA